MQIVKLSKEERDVIEDHLGTFRKLSGQMNQIGRQVIRERRDLQIAFSNAVRRDVIETGEGGIVPEFLGDDGIQNVRIDWDGTVTWAAGREPVPEPEPDSGKE